METPMQSALNRSSLMGRFILKTVIVSIAVIVSVIVIGDAMFTRLEDSFDEATRIGGSKLLVKLEAALDKAADPNIDMSSEQKNKLLADVRAITIKWRPLILEISSIVSKTPDSTESKTNK
jgi:hypothetical protein